MKIIGVDVGNSNIKIGFFENKKISKAIISPTDKIDALKIPMLWRDASPVFVGIASVVPQVNSLLKSRFRDIAGNKIKIITPSDCGIPLRIKNPDMIGVDRVLNCKAAINLFGSEVIVIDIGTAITVDYASEKGFLGGIIMPGPSLWSASLLTTAMIKEPKERKAGLPGKDTAEAIYGGIRYGVPGAINNVVEAYKKKYPSVRVLLTGGGDMKFIRNITFDMEKKHLALEGLGMVLYEKYGQN